MLFATLILITGLSALPAWCAEDLPVVFIPGILGSTLVDEQQRVVWGDALGSLRRFGDLELPLEPNQNRLRSSSILDAVSVFGPFQLAQYSSLIRALEGWGFKKDKTLFLFHYDWRQSNFDTAARLKEFIDNIPQLRGRKFNIVAHSMGGLVARIYIHRHNGGARVNYLVTLGTPHLGSAESLRTFLVGMGRLKNFVVGGEDLVRRVVFSFPSMYELLPVYDHCCILGAAADPDRQPIDVLEAKLWFQFGWAPPHFGWPQYKAFLERSLSHAAELRRLARTQLPEGVRLFKIAGDLIDTYSRVYLDRTGKPLQWDQFGGDGTVPLISAASGDLVDSEAAIHIHSTIFNDDHVKLALRRKLVQQWPLEEFAFQGSTAWVITRDDSLLRTSGFDIVRDDPYQQVGQVMTVRVRVRGETGERIKGIAVKSWLVSGSDSRREIVVTEDTSGEYRMSFNVPETAGTYQLLVNLPGVGLFEDYFIAVPREP